jgi:hypothetical protein
MRTSKASRKSRLGSASALRKSRFEAALSLARITAAEWAKQNGVTAGHLSQVLTGKRESASLTAKIEAFTIERLPDTTIPAAVA